MTQPITTITELTSTLVARGYHRIEGDTLVAPDDQFPEPGCWSYRADERMLMLFAGLPLYDFIETPFPIVVRCVHAPDSDELVELFIGTFAGDSIALLGWWPRLPLSMMFQLCTGVVRAWLISETDNPELASQYEEGGHG